MLVGCDINLSSCHYQVDGEHKASRRPVAVIPPHKEPAAKTAQMGLHRGLLAVPAEPKLLGRHHGRSGFLHGQTPFLFEVYRVVHLASW